MNAPQIHQQKTSLLLVNPENVKWPTLEYLYQEEISTVISQLHVPHTNSRNL